MRPLRCGELPVLPAARLAELRAAFVPAMPCELHQHWLPGPEPDFAPGVIWTAWHADQLLVWAELTDYDIFSEATGLNQKMWELGDVLEIFLRPVDQEAYVEFHVTPNNHRLQLRFPCTAVLREAQRTGRFDPFFIPGEAIQSQTWVLPAENRWYIYAQIPARSVGAPAASLAGQQWRYSFSRYDVTRGRSTPILSSTAAHTDPDFHDQAAWGTLQFDR
jgi:hypothetical protein